VAGSADNVPRVEAFDPSKKSHRKMADDFGFETTRAQAEAAGYTWTEEDEAAAHQAAADEAARANDPTRGERVGAHAKAARTRAGRAVQASGITTPVSSASTGLRGMLTGNNAGGTMAGFLFGFGAYCVALNFIRYGPKGAVGWLTAKFVNEPYDPSTGQTTTTSAVTALNASTSTSSSTPATSSASSTQDTQPLPATSPPMAPAQAVLL